MRIFFAFEFRFNFLEMLKKHQRREIRFNFQSKIEKKMAGQLDRKQEIYRFRFLLEFLFQKVLLFLSWHFRDLLTDSLSLSLKPSTQDATTLTELLFLFNFVDGFAIDAFGCSRSGFQSFDTNFNTTGFTITVEIIF